MERIEWRTLDWRTGVRASFQPAPDPRVSVIIFGDDSNSSIATWPVDRKVHGDMIRYLTLAGPKVVTFDVILDADRGEGDENMGKAAEQARNGGVAVITAATTTDQVVDDKATPADAGPTRAVKDIRGDIRKLEGDIYAFRPVPALRRRSLYGFANAPHGADGVQREIPLVVRYGKEVYPSLSLQTILSFYDVPVDLVRVRLGDAIYVPTKTRGELRIPISDRGLYLVNYRYDKYDDTGSDFHEWEYVNAMVALDARYVQEKRVASDLNWMRGGIVLIGQTVTATADAGPTPLGSLSPLVLVHANIVNNVLHDDYARKAPSWFVGLIAAVVGYLGLILGMRRSVWTLAAFAVLTTVLYVVASYGVWAAFSLWLPFMWPLMGFVLLQFVVIGRRVLKEQHAREQVKQMFGSYLSPELLERMMKGGLNVAAIGSERRPVTIMFSDLRDFTALTESIRDDLLIAQLNEYLEAMVECIHREGGSLHKFIGDAVMAVWGDLETTGPKNDAIHATRAALAMQDRLAQLNEKWKAGGKPTLRMGIGLNHGVVLIGNIGSSRKMEFTAIGDAVNLASRLESQNKELETSMLVGESVRELIESEFLLRPRGAVNVKGKQKPVAVYEVLGLKTNV